MAAPKPSKPRRIFCFICGNLKENDQKVALFSVPKNKLEEWKAAIGNSNLKATSKLCDVHFNSQSIIKGKVIGTSFFPYVKLWKLEKDALPTLLLGKSSSSSRQPLKDISSNKGDQGLRQSNSRSAHFSSTKNYPGMQSTSDKVNREHSSLVDICSEMESHLESDVTIPADTFILQDSFAGHERQATMNVTDVSSQMDSNSDMINQEHSSLDICSEMESHLESDVTIPADSFILQDSFADHESQATMSATDVSSQMDASSSVLNQEHSSLVDICQESEPHSESDVTVPADTVNQQGSCVKGTTSTKKRVFNRKIKSRIYPSRTSCFNCHAFVSLTCQRLRNTQRPSCIHCYRLIKRAEESDKKKEASDKKIKKLQRQLKTTKQKLTRSNNTIKELEETIDACQKKILTLTQNQVDEQLKTLPLKALKMRKYYHVATNLVHH